MNQREAFKNMENKNNRENNFIRVYIANESHLFGSLIRPTPCFNNYIDTENQSESQRKYKENDDYKYRKYSFHHQIRPFIYFLRIVGIGPISLSENGKSENSCF